MIHQLICENQQRDSAVVVVSLKTVEYAESGRFGGVEPVTTAVTAYYVVSKGMAAELLKTDLFYSSDDSEKNQIQFILGGRTPDIIRRRRQTGAAARPWGSLAPPSGVGPLFHG